MNFKDEELFKQYIGATKATFDRESELKALDVEYDQYMKNISKRSFLNELHRFLQTYPGGINKENLQSWLTKIDPKIEECKKDDFRRKVFESNVNDNDSDEYVYCRLLFGYYENRPQNTRDYWNGNLFVPMGELVFREFALQFIERENNQLEQTQEPIIAAALLGAILYKYENLFKDDAEQWLNRFRYPNMNTIDKIKLKASEAREDTDRLTLIAILAAIQESTGNSFDYNDFVLKRFGLTNFEQAKNKHKMKNTYAKVFADCRKILKI
jgi:hypothetical protein